MASRWRCHRYPHAECTVLFMDDLKVYTGTLPIPEIHRRQTHGGHPGLAECPPCTRSLADHASHA